MRIFSLALIVCSLLTRASATREYSFEIHIVNENVAYDVCTDAEFDDLWKRAIPTMLSVMADPKYDLKPTQESDWKTYSSKPAPPNRKERELQCNCYYCQPASYNPYLCSNSTYCPGCRRRQMLRSERELSDMDVLEIRSNTEGAMRGLLNKFVNTSPYSKDCTKAIMGATIGSTLKIL